MATIDKSKMDVYVDGKKVQDGQRDDGNDQRLNFQWWKSKREDIANDVQSTIKFLHEHQAGRLQQLTIGTRLYGNAQSISLVGLGNTKTRANVTSPTSQRVTFNLVASVIDTLTSKMAKNKVEPVFITNGGDWDIQNKAEQLSKFVAGCFYETDMYTKGVDAFTQSGAWGTGIIHIDEVRDKIFVEPAFPHEFEVDLVEALSDYPTQLHRVKIVERGKLLGCYPDKEDQAKIMAAQPAAIDQLGSIGTAADLVMVSESHHLPSDPDAPEDETDGRHVITVGGQWICNDPYLKTFYPYVFRRYKKPLLGFWGQSAAERLQNLQSEINREMILVQRSHWMGGSFKVLVENGSKVVSQHINNDVGAIIHYTGTKPEYVTPPMIQQDVYPWIEALINKGYRQEGVSEMEAASVKPMGVNSGKAMRTMANIADDRQRFMQEEDQRFYLECAKHMIEKAKDIYKRKRSYKVMFPTTSFAQTIDWKDIKLDETQYVMKAFPMSSLSDDLAGRLSDIQEYMQAGLISPRAGRRLMRKPDLEMADKLADAPEDLLHKIFEEMLSGKGYRSPQPQFDLTMAKELALEYYNYADLHNCPEERLALIDKFLTQLRDLTGENKPVAPPMAPEAASALVPPVSPQAVPAAPAVSQLLPNLPGKVAA